jgi:quercetin dioxygenase-like cupin family protein
VFETDAATDLPWICHQEVTATFFGMVGKTQIQTAEPPSVFELFPGMLHQIPPGVTYRLVNVSDAKSKYMTFHTGGKFDIVARPEPLNYKARIPTQQRALWSVDKSKLEAALDEDWDSYKGGVLRNDILARNEELRVLVLTLGAWNCVPWHYHDEVIDAFFCLDAPMRVETRDPRKSTVLLPGETFSAPKNVPHFVSGINGEPCRFIVVQGVGKYNYVPA